MAIGDPSADGPSGTGGAGVGGGGSSRGSPAGVRGGVGGGRGAKGQVGAGQGGRDRGVEGPSSGANDALQAFMTPNLKAGKPGALSMVPGFNVAFGLGMAFTGIAEAMGLEVGPAQPTKGSEGGREDTLPGDDETTTDEEVAATATREEDPTAAFDWYRGLIGLPWEQETRT